MTIPDEDVADVLDDLEEVSDRPLTPKDVQDLKRALFGDPAAFTKILYSDRSYFVIGSYNDEEAKRLLTVSQVLTRRRTNDYSFLMKDIPEFTANFALKFHVLVRRVDYVVGVFEHNRGGHEWEAGALSHPPLLEKVWLLKREYPTTDAERDAFDAMIAHFFDLIEDRNQLLEWTTDDELRKQTETKIP
ncbi:hypothetical protein OB955_03210 [Halobacteria archaeon AArc-m2/3/4]|uniref:Uncharacterized protein n=1 Tax=Natronoglomus mannanivorans TaxID=2979990 RepID=A0ABT2Q9Z8_9EURY|nr:hypothetical protein [Halobacteria archaeon AArc-m2/3/4]